MLRFAAAAVGLALVWAALRPAADAASLTIAGVGVSLALLALHGLGLLADPGASTLARAQLWLQRTGARLAGALSVLGAALSARPAAAAGLVRVRTRSPSPAAHAAFAQAVSATPGLVAVAIDEEALLLHALDEERVDVPALVSLELRAETALGERRA